MIFYTCSAVFKACAEARQLKDWSSCSLHCFAISFKTLVELSVIRCFEHILYLFELTTNDKTVMLMIWCVDCRVFDATCKQDVIAKC